MRHHDSKLTIAGLSLTLCTASLQHLQAQTTAATTSGPSAWVYVSTLIDTTNETDVHGFVAASNGKLTPITGLPFPADVSTMATNGKYLFGAPNGAGSDINSYNIKSDGALSYAASTKCLCSEQM